MDHVDYVDIVGKVLKYVTMQFSREMREMFKNVNFLFTDGVLKVDVSELDGRKGIENTQLVLGTKSIIKSFKTQHEPGV